MKTFSEWSAEKRTVREFLEGAHRERCRDLLHQVQLVGPIPIDSTWVRTALESSKVTFYDLACDTCRTELINPWPESSYPGNPPQMKIACPGCGWSSYVSSWP